MEKQKKILIPGGKASDWALVNAAHRLGFYVITSGIDTKAPAHRYADKYVPLDYSDKEAMLKLAKDENVDYMCSCANDFGMISTAYVCEKLGFPGHDSYETTLIIHNKDKFKPLAKKLGLHAPISEIFDNEQDAIEYAKKLDKKFIIKPVDNVASIGVSKPNNKDEIEDCVKLAFSKSKIKKILIEPFVEGFFTTVTSFIIDEKVVAFFADSCFMYREGEKVGDEFPANLRCTGGMQPSPFMDEWAPYIIEDFNKIAKELHLKNGKFHAELHVNPKDHSAMIFDVHRRYSGFADPWPEWDDTVSLLWEDWVLKAECGMDVSNFPVGIKQSKYFHWRDVFAPKNGKIKRVIFDTYLTAHLVSPSNVSLNGNKLILENVVVDDFYHQSIINVKFRFNTLEETEYIANPENDEFYKHIIFEYE